MSGLNGHLDLVCAARADGSTFIREQSFSAPVHLSKPHLDAGVLVVNVANPTAGLFTGDRIRYRVAVENGARVLLTAPSASRAHRMKTDEGADGKAGARVEQEFAVARGAWLECWPELFIPQGGARYGQRTVARVEEGGGLLMIEMIAPGRTASGEVFAFAELDWETEVFLGAEKIVRERYVLTPQSPSLVALRRRFSEAYYASIFIVTARIGADAECWNRIHALHREATWVGCSALVRGGWAIRVVAAGSVALRGVVAQVRREIYEALGETAPSLRRG